MSEFKPGDIVDITIKGARVRAWRPEVSELTVESKADANSDLTTYDYASAQVEVERVAPAEWPPHPGDLWRTKRQPYFAVDHGDGQVAMVNLGGEVFLPEFILAHGSLTLVHREDEQDGDAT